MNGLGPEREQPLPLEAKPTQGVALIIVRRPDRFIYTIRENETNTSYDKIAGMRSIPMETLKHGETRESALARLLIEEITERLEVTNFERVGMYGVGVAAVTCWTVEVGPQVGINPHFSFYNNGDGVSEPLWVPPDELINNGFWLRRGALEMVSDYLNGRKGVYRMSCQSVSLEPPRTFSQNGYSPLG